jgi:hypothetical protein
MKIHVSLRRASLAAAMTLLAMGGATTLMAAAPALNGKIVLRPLTPTEIKTYALTGTQGANGLNAIGVGQPAYLDALVNAAIAPSNIVSVTWTLTGKPPLSSAALVASPLGTNVPPGYIADRMNNSGAAVTQVASRMMLRPDMAGQYTVSASIVAAGGSGSTNLSVAITGATYVGVQTCELCHSGGKIAKDKYTPWSLTAHASFFTRAIDGLESDHYSKNCISCHTLGYDTNTNALNGGFDDVALTLGWTFPTVLTNGNWAALPGQLKNLSNIQCENCHGPGSEHAAALGNTNLTNWPRIGKTFLAGACAQCHDSTPNHFKSAEWNNSLHARVTTVPTGAGRDACARCHTGGGFAQYTDALANNIPYTTNNASTTYTAITCQTCHDPHDASNPHQLRAPERVLLADGLTTVTNAGAGALCMNCHRSRNGSVTNSIVGYAKLQQTWAGGSAFGPHDNPASDMLEGVNGWTYGKVIPSSAHAGAVTDTCVGCHMQTVTNGDVAFLQAGGHTWNMTYTNGAGASLDKVDVCVKCHGPITSFDMVKIDYNGDGVIEGVQTEVQHLLDRLSTMMPGSAYVTNGNYVADGVVKSSISTKTNWQAKFLEAGYNWQFVNNDLSKGVHNAAYAVGLLKASIGDLTGDANNDGIGDAWQILYFGSVSNPLAAPGANPAGDGIPNWVKFSLGLNPLVAGTVLPDGVVWANAAADQSGNTNSIQIYTAAEITFNTEVGKTYQLQSITSLAGGNWLNVGDPVPGTGQSYSFMTPTRNNTQQYFRVIHNP